MRRCVTFVADIRPFASCALDVISNRSDLCLIFDRYAYKEWVTYQIGRISVLNATASPTSMLASHVMHLESMTVCGKQSLTVMHSQTFVADVLGLNAQPRASSTHVSERTVLARNEKAPHAAPLDGTPEREEAFGLASASCAGRTAVAGFTTAHALDGCGAPGVFTPLSSPLGCTPTSDDIHLPPSRALPRATPGCAGCAERGWRRTPLGLRPAALQLTFGAAERRPSPPGVARGRMAASTAAASIRARRGRRALIFARLGPGSWPGAALGRRVCANTLNAYRADWNAHWFAGANQWARTAGAVRPTKSARLNTWLQSAHRCAVH